MSGLFASDVDVAIVLLGGRYAGESAATTYLRTWLEENSIQTSSRWSSGQFLRVAAPWRRRRIARTRRALRAAVPCRTGEAGPFPALTVIPCTTG